MKKCFTSIQIQVNVCLKGTNLIKILKRIMKNKEMKKENLVLKMTG